MCLGCLVASRLTAHVRACHRVSPKDTDTPFQEYVCIEAVGRQPSPSGEQMESITPQILSYPYTNFYFTHHLAHHLIEIIGREKWEANVRCQYKAWKERKTLCKWFKWFDFLDLRHPNGTFFILFPSSFKSDAGNAAGKICPLRSC